MNAMAVAQRMTAQEYLAEPDESVRSELVEGEVVVHGPGPPHQYVVQEIYDALRGWQRRSPGRGRLWLPLDVQIDERNVFSPDLLWYAEGRSDVLHDERPFPVPDLAIEVCSPSTWRYDIGAKKAAYERNGLPELWLVDPATHDVFVFGRSSAGADSFDLALELGHADTLTSAQLPGFAVALATIFPA